jgi:hypothetical protein
LPTQAVSTQLIDQSSISTLLAHFISFVRSFIHMLPAHSIYADPNTLSPLSFHPSLKSQIALMTNAEVEQSQFPSTSGAHFDTDTGPMAMHNDMLAKIQRLTKLAKEIGRAWKCGVCQFRSMWYRVGGLPHRGRHYCGPIAGVPPLSWACCAATCAAASA